MRAGTVALAGAALTASVLALCAGAALVARGEAAGAVGVVGAAGVALSWGALALLD